MAHEKTAIENKISKLRSAMSPIVIANMDPNASPGVKKVAGMFEAVQLAIEFVRLELDQPKPDRGRINRVLSAAERKVKEVTSAQSETTAEASRRAEAGKLQKPASDN